MTAAGISVFVFGSYLFIQGIFLFFAPNFLLTFFPVEPAKDGWVRLVGVALVILGYYYIRSGISNNLAFFRLTLHGRTLQLFLILYLIYAGFLPGIFLLFAGIEFLSAIWTFLALKKDIGE